MVLKFVDLQRGKSAPLCQLSVNDLLVTSMRLRTGGGFVIAHWINLFSKSSCVAAFADLLSGCYVCYIHSITMSLSAGPDSNMGTDRRYCMWAQVSYANCLLIGGYLSLVSCSIAQVRGRRRKPRWMTEKMVSPLSTNQQERTCNVHICKICKFPEMWLQNHKLTFNQGCKTVMKSMLDDGD